jgi:arsenite methyltransferase
MDYRSTEYNDNLELYLKQVDQLFVIPQIINEPQDKQRIITYYVTNKLIQLLYNWEGFFHFGISYDGKFKTDDLKEQARLVEKYIRDINAMNVLELACGLGANSAFLARRNPHVTFEAIDISNKPLRRYTKLRNVRFQFGDYHDLSEFADHSYDVIFAIEGLCYSTNKLQVLREVKKKLKKGGLFIVIDFYQRDRAAPLSQSEDIMWKLIEKSFSFDTIEYIKDVEGYMQKEYSIAVAKDVSQCVLPFIIRLESLLRYYSDHPALARVVIKLIPFDIVKSAIAGLLLTTSVRRQIGCYYIHVLKNDR